MKFIPILFSTPMVQALLDNRKTMTRRTIKPHPIDNTEIDGNFFEGNHKGYVKVDGHPNWKEQFVAEFSKYQPGDVLWVRESFIHNPAEYHELSTIHPIVKEETFYKADPKNDGPGPWKPSIHMPKRLCRIFLEVTDVRLEQLHDISEEDAIAEGIEMSVSGNGRLVYKHYQQDKYGPSPVHSFQTLWQSINGEESWNDNPWVWVVSFKRIDKPENFK